MGPGPQKLQKRGVQKGPKKAKISICADFDQIPGFLTKSVFFDVFWVFLCFFTKKFINHVND